MLQEKLQTIIPVKEEAGDGWASFESSRVTTGVPRSNFNQMPVGYDASGSRDSFGSDFGGEGDESKGITPKSLGKGYDRKQMGAADPQYTGEQCEQFYGSVLSDSGKESFVERANYLDRL